MVTYNSILLDVLLMTSRNLLFGKKLWVAGIIRPPEWQVAYSNCKIDIC